MIQAVPEPKIFDACRVLLGSEINLSRDFLFYLQPDGIKSAYHRKARETHPDLIRDTCSDILAMRTEKFRAVTRAYEVLKIFLKQRDAGIWQATTPHISDTAAPHHQPRKSHRTTNTQTRSKTHHKKQANVEVPQRKIPFGLYLLRRGIISHQTLIKALVWQRRQRPNLGDIACRWGWISPKNVQIVLAEHSCLGRFGEKAVYLNLLTIFEIKTLLVYQRSLQQRLGHYFVEHGYITATELKHLLRDFRKHNQGVSQSFR